MSIIEKYLSDDIIINHPIGYYSYADLACIYMMDVLRIYHINDLLMEFSYDKVNDISELTSHMINELIHNLVKRYEQYDDTYCIKLDGKLKDPIDKYFYVFFIRGRHICQNKSIKYCPTEQNYYVQYEQSRNMKYYYGKYYLMTHNAKSRDFNWTWTYSFPCIYDSLSRSIRLDQYTLFNTDNISIYKFDTKEDIEKSYKLFKSNSALGSKIYQDNKVQ